jgi:hypothetical protein
MFNRLLTACFRRLGGPPCFRVYGKARPEAAWRVIDVFATHRRDADSRWPRGLWPGTCITWTDEVVAVGWDFAAAVLREQQSRPATRERPLEVAGGRLHDAERRRAGGSDSGPCASEVLAHECGHTDQVRRLGLLYWPLVGALTLFREGRHWYNHFENQASATGLLGGIVPGSISQELIARISHLHPSPPPPS